MRTLWFLTLSLLFSSCSIPKPLIERIKEEGQLIVITRNNPATYIQEKERIHGLEYELVEQFAAELGVKVKYVIPESFDEILPAVVRGEAHFAAAGLTVTTDRELAIRFTPEYQRVTAQLVYKSGKRRPRKIIDTVDGVLEVMAGSSHEEQLRQLVAEYPDLNWDAQRAVESTELLNLVYEGLIDYTIANSNEVALSRRYHPELQVAFELGKEMPVAWAFPHAEDNSLYKAAKTFINRIKEDGSLEQLLERYYGYVEKLGFVDNRTFARHLVQRLPPLIPLFKEAAEQNDMDWHLLAAIGYQESHWNPKAVSPTGVKGIMMLTSATAKQMGIEDRTDTAQSISGGARYLRRVEKKLPERIQEPDRTWMALAGYNVGYGHLEDARILTQRNGGDPDKWSEVKQHLPLLAQKKYFETLKHGFARGKEPVHYVDNIRSYYDLLVWHNRKQKQQPLQAVVTTLPAVL
ncbi:membrane-bound lytic murein transglycosylase MltF [Sedimenticola hydrogenitrophicus]|uniref:membrane-bound lytic murein transglycosylase MltF n=1 Tax=Sedimenticola hydrogenitrophicus TaxID=2967975 RepID=UPI0021A34A12|nr:membrane-bound lytic murein transglycosylase MltF [Sedimenticola hydrogenitrophicus]